MSNRSGKLKCLKCLYSNVDQLLNKIDDLESMISEDAPDIMLFTEVIPKAQRNAINESQINIPGYDLYTNFDFTEENLGASGKRGVAVYVKVDIKSEKIVLSNDYDDQMWVEIRLRGEDKLLCGCIYRSPSKDKEKTIGTTSKVCQILNEAVQRKNTHVLICGDFNYPEIKWENEYVLEQTPVIGPFISTVQSLHLHQHIIRPTRYRYGQEPSLLDLVFTNEEEMLTNLIHNPAVGESDHECLRFDLDCYKKELKKTMLPNYYKGDYAAIRNRLKDVDWLANLDGNFQSDYSNFLKKLETSITGCIPCRKNDKKRKSIFFTREAIRLRDLKCKLWRRYLNTKTRYTHSRYVKVKNELRSLTRKLRFDFEKKIAENLKTAPKQFWAYVKSRTKTRGRIPTLKNKDNSLANTPSKKAEALNNFFTSVFTKEDLTNIPSSQNNTFNGEDLDTFQITKEMVQKKIQELNPGKTPGPDGWHPVFLKNIGDLIALPLSIIFQKSLDEGILPRDWLKACVTAIFKKGEKSLPENYRPVSITSIICKLMESIVRDKLVAHMVNNNLFSKNNMDSFLGETV